MTNINLLENESRHEISQWIKTRAAELGFEACGISRAGFLEKDDERLKQWLMQGYHGEMEYMTGNIEKRSDPLELLPWAKSVISFLKNYYPVENPSPENNYKISKYAYGRDYHLVIRRKLNKFIEEIRERTGELQARAFTDSAPVLERAWAEKSGLGRIGKNTCLIHPKLGSFVFISEIITDLELEYDDHQINDLCGGCTRCIDACPTGAIVEPRVLDARKCISYCTIEFRGELLPETKEDFKDWIFGCDVCQDVCPWNRKALPHQEPDFKPHPALLKMDKERWEKLTREDFNELFRKSAVKRTKYEGLKRNISLIIIFLLFLARAEAAYVMRDLYSRPDTLPPPPPEMTDSIAGPNNSCIGEISAFSVVLPLGCSCLWVVNGIIQPETSPVLQVTWNQPGIHTVSASIVCSSGTSDPLLKNVYILYQPAVFLGNDTTIIQGEMLTLDAGNPGSAYHWSTGETTQTIEVSQSGIYSVDVFSFCGADSDTIEVSFTMGTADVNPGSESIRFSVCNGKVIFENLPENTLKIQLFSLTGNLLYEFDPGFEMAVPNPGMYLVRVITAEKTCSRKVMVN